MPAPSLISQDAPSQDAPSQDTSAQGPSAQDASAQHASSIKPLTIYWLVCIAVGWLYLRPEIVHVPTILSQSHLISIGIGLVTTVTTMVTYDRVATTGMRSLHWPTFIIFPIANGILETIPFLVSFKIGTVLAAPFTTQPLWLFLAGTVTFFAYLAAIHALFWLKVLPTHLDKRPAVRKARIAWIISLTAVSLMWGWLYFTYQDFWSVAALHTLFDVGMVYSIRYRF